jgi:hypothetical protein
MRASASSMPARARARPSSTVCSAGSDGDTFSSSSE